MQAIYLRRKSHFGMIAIAQDDAQDFPQILRLYRREGGEFDTEAAPGSNSGDAREAILEAATIDNQIRRELTAVLDSFDDDRGSRFAR